MIIDAEKYYYHELVCTFYCEKDTVLPAILQYFPHFVLAFYDHGGFLLYNY